MRKINTTYHLFIANMTKYQLKYFNARARAEPIRLLLHYLKVPFDNDTIDFASAPIEWPKIKDRKRII